jgi:tetratricopeptide (TPR) repeat protein
VFRLKKTSTAKHKIVTAKRNPLAKKQKVAPEEVSSHGQSSSRNLLLSAAKSAALRQYESAIRLMYSQDFEGARTIFTKITTTFPEDKEIQERVKTHLRLCEQKMARKPSAPKSLEEHYDVGVALMNQGRYEEARDHYQRALKLDSQSDFVIYAMAALSCRTGDLESALAYLKAAIQLRPDNRYLAQHDSDFEPLMQDARFIAIIFPERLNSAAS